MIGERIERRYAALACLALVAILCHMPTAVAAGDDVETVVMVRHGEKPMLGLGQLNCQGLNRALALPHVLDAKFGKPDVIIAPDPAQQKNDVGMKYDYVRPLATIEPSAVYFGLPVSTAIGFDDTEALRTQLLSPAYRRSVVVVAWEHRIIEAVARDIVKSHGGDPGTVPKWHSSDFDSIYLLHIRRHDDKIDVQFSVDKEGLDHQSTHCPGA